MKGERIVVLKFRWPIVHVGDKFVEVGVPMGGDIPILDGRFISEFKLSDKEIDEVEYAVLESCVVVR